MVNRELSRFMLRIREKYKRSLRMRRVIFELNRLAEIRKKRKLTPKELEDRFLLWGDFQDELS
ncbi:MAG: hypothetical protein NT130_03550 [Candidatus Micrarchaeota archaeon]|nr:hypothetical protein [Candidatus Micrarchaeota archaeon]